MLGASFALLSCAVPLGGLMLAGRLRRLKHAHGLAAATAFVLLQLAWTHQQLRGPFALDAIVLLGGALCGGLLIAIRIWRRRPVPNLLLMLHAAAGGLAYLLIAGFVFGH